MGAGDAQRDFRGKRTLVNLLRAAHLVGVVGLGAGVLGTLPQGGWTAFAVTALASGAAILTLDAWSRRGYFRDLIGLAMGAKLILLGLLAAWPEGRAVLFWLILVLSVLLSHAPARVRHAVWWPRR